jgi:hypothetical protein
MMEHNKWVCSEWRCAWVGTTDQILTAPDPFNEGDTISACPKCREIGVLVAACDVDGCSKQAGCGTPTKAGYRWTCGAHMPKDDA